MKTEEINFENYLNANVKIFPKGNKDPVTGRVLVIKKKFIVLLAKKAIKQEGKIVYRKRIVKKDNIEKINLN